MRNVRVRQTWLAVLVILTLLATSMASVADAATNDFRIDPALLAQAKSNPTKNFSVIVQAASTKNKADHRALAAANAIKRAKGTIGHGLSIVGGASAVLSGANLIALTRDPDVSYITADHILKGSFDPVTGATNVTAPGVIEVNAPAAWKLGVTGRGIGVAVVDSGVANHSDLAGRIVASVDFTSGAPGAAIVSPADPGGHGTHVAGIVAGDGTASGGAYTGIAPGANIIDVRVIGATGATNSSTVLRGLQWVLANRNTYNIRVVNLSLGAPVQVSYKQDPLAAAVEVLTFAKITIVAAAGNAGPGDSTIATPGYDPYVITVGAIDDAGTTATLDDLLTGWSSRGPTKFDGLAKPDISAPGRKLISLRSEASTLDQLYSDRRVPGKDPTKPAAYFRLSGTSMATPVVAGTVALMLERTPTLTPAQIKRRLKATATPLSYGAPNVTGAGMVNVLAAVSASDIGAEAANARVSNSFANNVLAHLVGQRLVWRDLSYHGGVDSRGTAWTDVTWSNIVWDEITWEDIAWEAFTWTDIAWEGIAWEDIAWETTTLSVGTLASSGAGWSPVD